VLPFGPGSATDTISRVLAEELRMALGQPFVIDYKSGASARIGAELAARAPADGYTLFVGTNTSHSANPHLFRKLGYDPVKDFAPISFLISFTSMLVVDPRVPANNVTELVAYLRANPDRATYAWGNAISRLAAASLLRTAGVPGLGVPYKSHPQAVTDVIAGAATLTIVDVVTGHGFVQAGRLRALAVVRGRRSPLLPDLPAVAETPGFAGFDISSWVGLFAPAGTPRAIIETLNAATRKGLGKSEVRGQFAKLSAEVETSSPEELGEWVVRQLDNWGRRVRDAGIDPE
jgi:tripartite-type tricarboxylate transporter receptor subunit TctC